MANQEHLNILKQGVEAWNQWRKEHTDIRPDLSEATLTGDDLHGVTLEKADLFKANLTRADLSNADLSYATLRYADLSYATLREAKLRDANLRDANLSYATLTKADLTRANLHDANFRDATLIEAKLTRADFSRADFSHANLSKAYLNKAILVQTKLNNANLTNCKVHGISVWEVDLIDAKQDSLIITDDDEPTITVDNLEVAQFIYLLLNNQKIRDVIDTITSKVVLILGRFTSERKAVLDALRDRLRKKNYSPVVFDFEKPANRDVTETISTLAHMARFVIADITDAKSIPQELMAIVPNLPSVPVQPLILESQDEYGMFEHFKRFPWVLPVYRYTNEGSLLEALQEKIIAPAEQKVKELEKP